MTKNSFIIPMLAGIALVGGVGMSYAGLASAQTTTGVTTSSIMNGWQHMQGVRPGVHGTVSAVSGNTLTVTSKNRKDTTTTTYTVDVTNATVHKPGAAGAAPVTGTLADIKVGDMVGIKGTVTGTSVVATDVMDGLMKGGPGGKGGHAGMHAPAGNDGTITSINGSTVIMQEEANEGGTSYTVDASGATVTKAGVAGTLGSLTVGDKIFVKGAVTGTNVVATAIADGHGGHMKGGFHGKGPKAN